MKVSICIVAYNCENYITQSVESVMNQKVSFDYEILINDDASTDNTVAVVRTLQEKYPGIITLYTHEVNQYQQGKYAIYEDNLFINAKGEYIAMLDGDDFFTDENKLAITVDFLERNKDYSMVLHNCESYYENPERYEKIERLPISPTLTTRQIIGFGSIIFPPCTIVFRNVVKVYPSFMNAMSLDRKIAYLLMTYGKIAYIDKIMSAYRRHETSFISKKNKSNKNRLMINNIQLLEEFDRFSHGKYHAEIQDEKSIMAKLVCYFGSAEEHKIYSKHLKTRDRIKVTIYKLREKLLSK